MTDRRWITLISQSHFFKKKSMGINKKRQSARKVNLSLFSGKNKKNISKCCLLKFIPRVLSHSTSQNALPPHIHVITVNKVLREQRKTDTSFTTLCTNSADDKLAILFLFPHEKKVLVFHAKGEFAGSVKFCFLKKKKKKIQYAVCWKITQSAKR